MISIIIICLKMEMENLKALLNNCNTQHEFVKLCDLEQEKKYEVTCFENINTKFDSKYKIDFQ
ncbi:Uncharacterized protein FWK35_00029710, partial [Aphis craccivora]